MAIRQESLDMKKGPGRPRAEQVQNPAPQNLQAQPAQAQPVVTQDDQLPAVPTKFGYPVVAFNLPEVPQISDERKAELAPEMDGLGVSFDRVKIPAGGSITWELPAEEGQEIETSKALEGVIVDHYPIRSLYLERYEGSKNPPDCSSLDCITGITKDGVVRSCAGCEYNQRGSHPDNPRRKRCDDKQRIYLLQDTDDAFPLLIVLPPGSLLSLGNWLGRKVILKGLRSCDVVTRLTLSKATSNDGITFSQVNFAVAGIIAPEQQGEMKAYTDGIRVLTRKQKIDAEDYAASGEGVYAADREPGQDPSDSEAPTVEVYQGGAKVNLPEEPNF